MTLNSLKIGIRKILSLASVLVLVFALVPTYVFAAPDSSIDSQADTNLIASGTWGTCPWEIDAEGTLTVYPGKGATLASSRSWEMYKDDIKKAVFLRKNTNRVLLPSSLSGFFQGYSNLITVDFSGADFSTEYTHSSYPWHYSDFSCMFDGCSSLTEIKGTAQTMWTKNTSCMFRSCSSLVNLDLSSLRAGEETARNSHRYDCSMTGMFEGCTSLMSLDLSNFDNYGGYEVKREAGSYGRTYYEHLYQSTKDMFAGCDSLISLSLHNRFKLVGDNHGLVEATWIDTKTNESVSTESMPSSKTGEEKSYSLLDAGTFDFYSYKRVSPSIDPPLIVEGKNLNWIVEGKDGARFRSDAPIQVFENVKVDGAVLDESDYELTSGSTAVTLTPSYLGTLSLGEHTIDITSLNGTASTTFTITKSLESSAELNLSQEKFLYDGTQKKPAIAVKVGDVVLQEGVDYEVSYPDIPVAVGTYTATITGKGNYSGTKTISYEIVPAAITSIALDATKFTHDGTQKRPAVTVKCGNKTLAEGTDYMVEYPASSAEVGTYTVIVTGKGNYAGTKQATFEIVEASKPTPDEPKPDDPGAVNPKPDEPKPDDPGAIDPKPDDPGTRPDNPGTTDPDPGNPGTQPEGPGATDPQPDDPGTVAPEPVATQVMYRAYNPNSGEHFYTASYGEIEAIVAAGWQYEGEAWTAPVTSAVPVYRLYSGTDHHYTTSAYERDELLKVGWSDEGVGWYSDEAKGVGLHRLFNPNVDPNAVRNNSGSHHYTTSEVERDHLVSIGWRYEDYGWYGVR